MSELAKAVLVERTLRGDQVSWLEKKLLGRTVTGIRVSEGEDYLVFDTDAGEVVIGTDADCCSETWFSDVMNPEFIIGGIVLAANDIDMSKRPDDGRSRQEKDDFYGVEIVTDKGIGRIEYRNSSNGYYGGSARLVDSAPESAKWVSITSDWSA